MSGSPAPGRQLQGGVGEASGFQAVRPTARWSWGCQPNAIFVEPKARNAGENSFLFCALLEERREYATTRKLWPRGDIIGASFPWTLAEYADPIGAARLVLDMLVGAQQRLIVYPK
ncbi:hypothetical protein ACFCZR_11935 [Streptomyces rubiginosohelvolus]|uniref:hypothetical protein n=1 Tax=Streptomyces rubiginosohelvolus TaxID=67362 RepID=UPI0035DCA728